MSQNHREEHDGLSVAIEFGNEGELNTPHVYAPTGDSFGLHDPETWEYVSLERKSAEYIAQGFPVYWENHANELLPDQTASEAAEIARNATAAWFSGTSKFPSLPVAFSFDSVKSKNPFDLLWYRHTKLRHDISVDLWHQYCESLFRQLINSNVRRYPEIFFFSPVRDWTMRRHQAADDSNSFAYRAEFDVYCEFTYCPHVPAHLVRVTNRQGDVYRLYQPETWQYVSLSRQVAEDICGGFPEYWDDRPDEELDPSDEAAKASLAHRRRVIHRLAQQSFPLPKLFHLSKSSLMHLPEATRNEVAAIRTSNPFVLVEQQMTYSARPDESPVSHVWRSWATDLFEHLLTCKHVVKQPLFVGVPESDMQPWDDDDEEPTEPTLVDQIPKTDSKPPVPDDVSHQRGPTLIKQEALESLHERTDKRPVQWGPLFYEESAAYLSHFCVAGMPRSGKTTLLRLLFQSLHTNVTPQPRFLFYDAKAKLLPFLFPPGSLAGEGSNAQAAETLFILSPFDARGVAWDIAKDATNQVAAREIAQILFPKPDPTKKEFFSTTVWDVAVDLMTALTRKAGTQWTLFDLLCSMQLENIEAVMSSNPGGLQRYQTYFRGTSGSTDDIIKSLRNESSLLLPLAATWRLAKDRLSLRSWVKSQTKSIVLFHVKKYDEASTEINRILLNILSQELLTVDDPPARTFVYLDEFEHLGRINQMTSLAHDGASLKVNMAMAFHDLGTLEGVYHGATEGILGDANFQAFLKVRTRRTSDWASDQIGSPEVKVKQKNTQRGSTKHEGTREADPDRESSQSGESISEHYAIRRLVLPDEIRSLPTPDEAKNVSGYFLAPGHGPYLGTLPASKVFRSAEDFLAAQSTEENFYSLWPKAEGVSELCPHPDELYDVPDDTFFTLHQLGFVKPGYVPPITPTPPPETPLERPPSDEQTPSNPPPATDTSAADDEKRISPPPSEPDCDFKINLDLGDD